jgi:hypothetical protein
VSFDKNDSLKVSDDGIENRLIHILVSVHLCWLFKSRFGKIIFPPLSLRGDTMRNGSESVRPFERGSFHAGFDIRSFTGPS